MSELNDKTPIVLNAISVSELSARISSVFSDNSFFSHIDIFGEVSGFKLSGAHAYFTIKDQYSQLSCVRFDARRDYIPTDGESVILRGSVDYYIKGGRLTFKVSSITPVGQGLLFLQFERMRAKLTEEGLFDDAHKKTIPQFPRNVLVVTSKTGAVIRDIVTTIRRKNPVIDIVVRDVRVQGDGAAKEICSVLKSMDLLNYDVIILARGGGSLEDLAPFYDEELVRTIYNLNTPIISAIGHETDFSLADFVADARAATPTAAGELVAYDYYGMANHVLDLSARMSNAIQNTVDRKTRRVVAAVKGLSYAAKTFYAKRTNTVFDRLNRLSTICAQKLSNSEHRLERAMTALDNLSPLKTLKRGYFKLETESGAVTSVKKLNVGERIKAVGGDGAFEAEVTRIIPE